MVLKKDFINFNIQTGSLNLIFERVNLTIIFEKDEKIINRLHQNLKIILDSSQWQNKVKF